MPAPSPLRKRFDLYRDAGVQRCLGASRRGSMDALRWCGGFLPCTNSIRIGSANACAPVTRVLPPQLRITRATTLSRSPA